MRTAFCTVVREAGDLSAGVFDRQGRMLAQAVTGTPGHVNSMAESVGHFLDEVSRCETMKPGDVYLTNDPWLGTGHLYDFTVVTPAFKKRPAGRAVRLDGARRRHRRPRLRRRRPLGVRGRAVHPDHAARRRGHDERAPARHRRGQRARADRRSRATCYSLAACNEIGCRRLVEMMDEFALETLDELARARHRQFARGDAGGDRASCRRAPGITA